ncbi:MAG: AraC family transcriptional regulator [Bacteroidetes bacterium]|nr:AraC family transcriptional regulator [Bacteroidota bacterium]
MSISSLENEYRSRINRVMDYIEAHMGEAHTLEHLASIANFSKFHFHRIFLAMTGETPFQFLTRIRIEKAANMLKYNPARPVSEIADICGFSGLALFSRTFRQYFGLSPTNYRKTDRNQCQHHSKEGQAEEGTSIYFCPESKTIKWRTHMKLNKSMEVRELPKTTVAYIRHTGPYQGDSKLFEKLIGELCRWAGPKGLLRGPDMKIIIIYHDDPQVTEQDKLRMSVSIPVPPETRVDGKIGKMDIAAGTYAIGRFEVKDNEFSEAWGWMYGTWLPQSGYQPDDGPCLEIYTEEVKKGEKIKVDICVPVKPL